MELGIGPAKRLDHISTVESTTAATATNFGVTDAESRVINRVRKTPRDDSSVESPVKSRAVMDTSSPTVAKRVTLVQNCSDEVMGSRHGDMEFQQGSYSNTVDYTASAHIVKASHTQCIPLDDSDFDLHQDAYNFRESTNRDCLSSSLSISAAPTCSQKSAWTSPSVISLLPKEDCMNSDKTVRTSAYYALREGSPQDDEFDGTSSGISTKQLSEGGSAEMCISPEFSHSSMALHDNRKYYPGSDDVLKKNLLTSEFEFSTSSVGNEVYEYAIKEARRTPNRMLEQSHSSSPRFSPSKMFATSSYIF